MDVLNPVATADERRAQKAVAAAAAKAAKVRAEEAPAAPVAVDPPPLVVEPEAPEVPDTEDEPTYKDGDLVASSDSRRPIGKVVGAPKDERCYTVQPDDGTEPYVSAESEMKPHEAPKEEPMTDETTAPDTLIEALGLTAGANMGQAAVAAKAMATDLRTEREQAKSAALVAANVDPDLKGLVMGAVVREGAEDWTAAVARVKGTMPRAFLPDAVVETVDAEKPAEKPAAARPDLRTFKPLPAGASAPDRKNETPKTDAPKGAKSWREKMPQSTGRA